MKSRVAGGWGGGRGCVCVSSKLGKLTYRNLVSQDYLWSHNDPRPTLSVRCPFFTCVNDKWVVVYHSGVTRFVSTCVERRHDVLHRSLEMIKGKKSPSYLDRVLVLCDRLKPTVETFPHGPSGLRVETSGTPFDTSVGRGRWCSSPSGSRSLVLRSFGRPRTPE